ncbi:MAG: hypothetical protein WKF34_07835 [Pyrinomonadaceae bacterium]
MHKLRVLIALLAVISIGLAIPPTKSTASTLGSPRTMEFGTLAALWQGVYDAFSPRDDIEMSRPDASGDLDLTFNGSGKATLDIAPNVDRAAGVVVQADNKIVVAGNGFLGTAGTQSQIELARYNVDGTLDTSFDGDGIVTTALFTRINLATAIFLTPDQKIWVLGRYQFSSSNSNYVGFIVRYNANGSLDTTFGAGSGFSQVLIDSPAGMAVDATGRILVVGSQPSSPNQARVQRFNANGSVDTTFGPGSGGSVANGTIQIYYDANPTGVNQWASSIIIQPDGKYVVGGFRGTGNSSNYGLARLNPDGTYDLSFDTDGRVATAGLGGIRTLILQPDQKILAIGTVNENFNATRYNNDGSLDMTFGSGTGRVTTDVIGIDTVGSGYLQPDGNIVVGGATGGVNSMFGVVRYTSAGDLDLTFNTDGKQTIDFTSVADGAVGAAPDSLGRVILAGNVNNFAMIGVTRLEGDGGTPTPTPTATATPTATPTPGPPAIVDGLVTITDGRALRNAIVAITGSTGARRTVITNSFGFYQFGDVVTGQSYTMSVLSRRYRFAAQQVNITGNATVNFVGLE